MGPVDRRRFIGELAAAAGTTVLPRTAWAGRAMPVLPAPAWSPTPCRFCGVSCGLQIGVENRRAAAVRGDPDSPVSRGMACAKGYHAIQALYGPDRITRALVRRNGVLVAVSLDEALDAVASALQATIRSHGKDSAGIYGSAQWSIHDAYVAGKLCKAGLGTNNVETSSRLYAAAAIAGAEATYGLDGGIAGFADVDHADVVVVWDTNLAESDPVLFSRILDRRRSDPAVRIIELATRTTRTSYAADRSILHTPHAGLAIAHAIAHELASRAMVNRDFVARYVAFKRGRTDVGHGLADDALVDDAATDATFAEYTRFVAQYAPDRISDSCGIPADVLRWLASVYADRSRRVLTVWGSGVHTSARGAWLNAALHALHLLTGKVGTPGNGPLPLTGQPGGGCSVHDPGSLAHTLPRGTVDSERDRRRAATIWNVAEDRIDPRPGRPALAMFRALDRGDLRFLWIQATNPMVSLPNIERYRRAARRDDRFIVVSEAYPTPTTDIADVVLPAALWLEREGVTANAERRLQYAPALVPPPGDATADAWLMIEVARRMGLGALFPWTREDHVAQGWEEYRRFHDVPLSALPSFAELQASRGVQWPVNGARESPRRYSTVGDVAARPARGDLDFYGHADGRAWIWLRPVEPPAEAPDIEFPFWLETGPVLEHWGGGSLTQRIPALHRSIPHAYVEINRDDAARLGIGHGDRVRLSSRRGSLDIEARIDYRAQPPRGLVFVPTFDEGHPVNRLTLDAQCPLSGQPGAGACAVRVERVPSRGAP